MSMRIDQLGEPGRDVMPRHANSCVPVLNLAWPQVRGAAGARPAVLPQQARDPPGHQAREPAAGAERGAQDRGLWVERARAAQQAVGCLGFGMTF